MAQELETKLRETMLNQANKVGVSCLIIMFVYFVLQCRFTVVPGGMRI